MYRHTCSSIIEKAIEYKIIKAYIFVLGSCLNKRFRASQVMDIFVKL